MCLVYNSAHKFVLICFFGHYRWCRFSIIEIYSLADPQLFQIILNLFESFLLQILNYCYDPFFSILSYCHRLFGQRVGKRKKIQHARCSIIRNLFGSFLLQSLNCSLSSLFNSLNLHLRVSCVQQRTIFFCCRFSITVIISFLYSQSAFCMCLVCNSTHDFRGDSCFYNKHDLQCYQSKLSTNKND